MFDAVVVFLILCWGALICASGLWLGWKLWLGPATDRWIDAMLPDDFGPESVR